LAVLIIFVISILSACGTKKHSSQGVAQKPVIAPARDLTERKRSFFGFLRPIIESENAVIMKKREKLLALKDRFEMRRSLSGKEQSWLVQLEDEYGVERGDPADNKFWRILIMRVDTIPVELALAQAANESAWGTSRFAREGNNYFGQWCHTAGCGIVPARRAVGARHEVRRFSSAAASVHSYLHNLNTSRAYAELRRIRYRMRRENVEADAIELARGLGRYSERGEAYIRSLQGMIRKNRDLMKS